MRLSDQRRAELGDCEVGYDGDILGRAEARGSVDAGGIEPAIWLELQRSVDTAADVARAVPFVGDPAFVRGGEVVALDRDGVGQPEDDDRRPADALNLDSQQQAKVGGDKLEVAWACGHRQITSLPSMIMPPMEFPTTMAAKDCPSMLLFEITTALAWFADLTAIELPRKLQSSMRFCPPKT